MNKDDEIDLAAISSGTDEAFVEDLTDSAAAYSTIATGSTLGTATGCASSFSSLSSLG
jgi:hypothetical protein